MNDQNLIDTNINSLRAESDVPLLKTYDPENMADFQGVYSTHSANTLKLMFNEYLGSKAIKHTSTCILDQDIVNQTWTFEHNIVYDYIRTSLRHTSNLIVKKLQPMQMTPLGWNTLPDVRLIGIAYLREDETTWLKHKFWHTFVLLHAGLSYIAHSEPRGPNTSVFNFTICNYKSIFDEQGLFAKE